MNTNIEEILTKINELGFNAYIVGGYVRDYLLGIKSTDIDICTDAKIKDLITIFNGNANECGSLNIKTSEYNIDITTFRKEENYVKRKPTKITFINDLQSDLKRRDFTINTICFDKDNNIIDYYNGRNDLNNKIIRAVEDANLKITEDPLRILRAIRFATTLDFYIEKELDKVLKENSKLVKDLSLYRIKEEISKILLSKNYQKGLNLLKKYKIDEYLGIKYQNLAYTSDILGMWSQIENIDNFPFTKNEKNTIVKIRKILDFGIINNDIIYEYGLYLSTVAGEILGIDSESIYKIYQNMPIYTRNDLNITYLEIARILKVKPSKKVKDIEKKILKEVLNNHIENNLEMIKKYLINNKERWELNE